MEIDLRYPIGKFVPAPFNEQLLKQWIIDIQYLPQHLENAVVNLDEVQLHTPYRDEGWTLHQVVHHVADSHMNAFIRFKLGLTENHPTIKPYVEYLWANLADVKKVPVNVSITLLHAVHIRWLALLNSLSEKDFSKTVFHPEHNKEMSLWYLLGLYAWHGRHHTAHITSLRERMGW
jgi:uncharacterized damage-inducible protein DinB